MWNIVRTAAAVLAIVTFSFGLGFRWKITAMERPINRTIYGDFEWQWTGENWMASVLIDKDKQGRSIANMDARQLFKTGPEGHTTIVNRPVFKSAGDGSMVEGKDKFKLILPLQVYNPKKKEFESRLTIETDLAPTDAYAGEVKYINQDGAVTTGDMILVRHRSQHRNWPAK